MIFFFNGYANQFPDNRCHNNYSRKRDNEGKRPCFQPDGNNIGNQSDIKDTDDQGHKAGHEKRHKKTKYNMLISTVYHVNEYPFCSKKHLFGKKHEKFTGFLFEPL